ncbi:MAG: S46 family peptidase [Bacteroidota bacterium]
MIRKQLFGIASAALISLLVLSGCSTQEAVKSPYSSTLNLDTVKAGQFDTGKMWTFDFPPTEYFAKTYGFNPSKDWFDKTRLSAVRIPGCTASFVSEDGLIMTNHHCARRALDVVNKEGERLAEQGFYAATLDDERKSPVTYVDQLVVLDDVTDEVQKAFESGTTDEDKVSKRSAKFVEIQQRYAEKYRAMSKDSMIFNVIPFYNGGKYSLYGYKRYTDVRLVFAPEEAIAFFGGDPDNFTYPRYDFDCSFFRVYENGKPLKTSNFFKFSKDGAKENEAVFVIGNPGSSSRLQTVAQLEFNRDFRYPYNVRLLSQMEGLYEGYVAKHPTTQLKYQTQIFGYANSRKGYGGRLDGLHDPYLLARKKDFEKSFKNSIMGKPELKVKYGTVWSEIESFESQRSALYWEVNAYTFEGLGRSVIFSVASNLVYYANQMKLPEAQRTPRFKGAGLEQFKSRIFPTELVPDIDKGVLAIQLGWMNEAFGTRNEQFNTLLKGRPIPQAADELWSSSNLSNKEHVTALLNGSPDDILNSADPLISFVAKTTAAATQVRDSYNEISAKEAAKVQLLGQAMYGAYGTTFPPDATFTLRIADGVVKGYDYNGTIAPINTTFYGMYDRYYSFGKKIPFELPDRWKNPPADFNLSTPINFVSTNDIIGGNSGSPMINKNQEVVGLIFDGNIESLPGEFIFTDEKNRTVSVHSSGLLEGLEKIYKATRVSSELRAGRIAQ